MSTTPVPGIDPVAILVGVADGLWAALSDLSPTALAVGAGLLTVRLGFWLFKDTIARSTESRAVHRLYDRAEAEWDAGCYGQARSTWASADRAAARWERKWS